MIDRFSELLLGLGKELNLSLVEDEFRACSISTPPLTIHLELDPSQEQLFLFSKIIELPPGRFRENIFEEALKANDLNDPRPGIFGYLAKSNHLTLHQVYPVLILNGERLSGLFSAFFELGRNWHEAISRGNTRP
jgi:hypothetical protein